MTGSRSDADPGSGALLTPGSGIWKKSGSEMNLPEHFSESLVTVLGFLGFLVDYFLKVNLHNSSKIESHKEVRKQ